MDVNIILTNTGNTHILLEYAKSQGRQTALKLRLFAAFFTEEKDVFNRQTLANELKVVGLNVQEAMEKLADKQAQQAVLNKNHTGSNLVFHRFLLLFLMAKVHFLVLRLLNF